MLRALSSYLVVNHRVTVAWLDRLLNSGVGLLEFFCARQSLDYRDRNQISELGHWFRDSKMKLHSIHAPLYDDDCWGRTGPSSIVNIAEPDKMRRRHSVDEIKRAIEISEQIPCRYLVQHMGMTDEEFDDRKLDAAFSSLEELNVFARQRGVEVLLENTPNRISSAERLLYFLGITHLDNYFCFDIGHALLQGSVEREFEAMKPRIRSTHIHDNDGVNDIHLFPMVHPGGKVNWRKAMQLLSPLKDVPIVLEIREDPAMEHPLDSVRQVFEKLEEAAASDHD